MFYHKKGVHFGLKIQCFITKKELFWAEKSVFWCKKGGNFQIGEQGWVPLFPVSEEARGYSKVNIELVWDIDVENIPIVF